ncbi:uncharacterized protein LOC125321203 [Corvus hawaiiensis]|uniref:uncharacterized protein LOC125321203 n=1 Tax=Corvus hawaiiensis TaxID=134902 RepID=UPI0020194605|nr:uncharacterized protein LOC125321203 [Corvus hawaiiensis]
MKIGTAFAVALLWSLWWTTKTAVHHIDHQEHMWVTWANQTGQESFCLSLATPSDPFRTCLIGVPLTKASSFKSYTSKYQEPEAAFSAFCVVTSGSTTLDICKTLQIKQNPLAAQAQNIALGLNTSTLEPQELDLLGSQPGPYCLMFGYYGYNGNLKPQQPINVSTWLSPTTSWYSNGTAYCNGSVWPVNDSPQKPRALPSGTFLICRDRAWPGVPSKPMGGPCYFGKLTMIAPSIQQILNITHKRSRRSICQLGPDCRDNVELWEPPAVFFASLLAPGVASAHALTQLKKLACWAGKQANVTSDVLRELATDVDSLRHALLQNCAAIDFLLLAQGHGCQEFEGMCRFNLSDHSTSIHKQLQWLREHTQKLTVESNPFDQRLASLFGNLSPWMRTILTEAFHLLSIIFAMLLIIRISYSCIIRQVTKITNNVLLVQKEKTGIVEGWLQERGHET